MSESHRPSDDEPVNAAVHQLAMHLHSEIVNDLEGSSAGSQGFDQRLDQHRRTYPALLFGELAMHLAEVELPPNASAPDRARGIVEALRRIATTPQLFEAITNAPYTTELAKGINPSAPAPRERSRKATEQATKLREKIAQAGYLQRNQLDTGQVVQLNYRVPTVIKKSFGRREQSESTINLKLAADAGAWVIRQYNLWDGINGYTKYRGNTSVSYDYFRLLAAASPDGTVPDPLQELVGNSIGIGSVTSGSPLQLWYDFRRNTQEVPGHRKDMTSKHLSLGGMLMQAYVGDSLDFPIFADKA